MNNIKKLSDNNLVQVKEKQSDISYNNYTSNASNDNANIIQDSTIKVNRVISEHFQTVLILILLLYYIYLLNYYYIYIINNLHLDS